MTVREHGALARALPCELVPAADLLSELRAVKDPEELEIMVSAQRIAERALAEILNEIRPGVTEKEIAARLQYLMLHHGAEDMSFDPIVVSGPNGSLPHGVPSEKAIQSGEFVTMDFGCVYHGYCSDMTRTVAVGSVTDEMRRVYDTCWRPSGPASMPPGAVSPAMTWTRPPGMSSTVPLWAVLRPQLRPRRGRGDPRRAQRHPLQRPSPARRGGDLRRAGHLPAGEAGGADRGRAVSDRGRLPEHHPGPKDLVIL